MQRPTPRHQPTATRLGQAAASPPVDRPRCAAGTAAAWHKVRVWAIPTLEENKPCDSSEADKRHGQFGMECGRVRTRLPQVRGHDLKHTFGRRFRAAGVSFEDRQDQLGRRSGRITTHCSGAELSNLIDSANKVCGDDSRKTPALVLIR